MKKIITLVCMVSIFVTGCVDYLPSNDDAYSDKIFYDPLNYEYESNFDNFIDTEYKDYSEEVRYFMYLRGQGIFDTDLNPILEKSYVRSFEKEVTRYIYDELKDKDELIIEIQDIALNNPAYPESFTIFFSVNGQGKYLVVAIPSKGRTYTGATMVHGDSYITVESFENILNYVDEPSDDGYSQYVKIKKAGFYKDSGVYYYTFLCEVYIQSLSFGENSNGKFDPIPSKKIGD